MKLYFKKDYCGRETAMKEYVTGQTDDFGVAQALELIKLDVAEEVEEAAPPAVEPKRKRKADK